MAQKRMFSLKIIDTDLFLDMPMSSRLLYYDLSMRADDDGFVGSPKKITKMVGCSDDDLKLLIAKQFIIPFESGVCVIKDWKIHNYIAKDRYNPTTYTSEKQQLEELENSSYTLCIQGVDSSSTQVRLGKDRLGEDSLEEDKPKSACDVFSSYANGDFALLSALKDFEKMRKSIKRPLSTDRAKQMLLTALDKLTHDNETKIKILDQSILHSWQTVFELKDDYNNQPNRANRNYEIEVDKDGGVF